MASSDTPFMGLVKKTCPDCAEEIQVEAQVCRHCGRRLSEAEMAAGQEQAQARAAAFTTLVALFLLERKRKVRFGWGIALTVIGGLLQLLFTAMVLLPPAGGNTAEAQRFAGLSTMAMTLLPLLLPGIVLIRSARRIRREWQATLDRNEEEALCARIDCLKWSRLDWGAVLAFIGTFLLVIRIACLPPAQGEKDAQGRAAIGVMCVVAGLLPLLLGGVLLLRGWLAKRRDENSLADGTAAPLASGGGKLAAALNSLDQGGAVQLGEYLNRASPEEAAALGRRLSSATPDQIRQMVRNLEPGGTKSLAP